MPSTDPVSRKRVSKRPRHRDSRGQKKEVDVLHDITNEPAKQAAQSVSKSGDIVKAQSTPANIRKKPDRIPAKREVFLTPAQFAKLKSGPKIDVFVGPPGNQFIGIEAAFRNLWTHYSVYAQNTLDRGSAAVSVPHGSKRTVRWIYGYMLAGEQDPAGEGVKAFNEFDVRELVHLYSHAAVLQFQSLMDRIHGRLYHWVVQEGDTVPDHVTVENIVHFVPALIPSVATAIAQKIVQPLVKPSDWLKPYFKITGFESVVESAVYATLKKLIGKGEWFYRQPGPRRYSKWLNRTYYYRERYQTDQKDALDSAEAPSTKPSAVVQEEKANKPNKGSRTRRSKKPHKNAIRIIYPEPVDDSIQRQEKGLPQQDFLGQVTKERNKNQRQRRARKERTSSKELISKPVDPDAVRTRQPIREPPVCYNCNERGHIVRNCLRPRVNRAKSHDHETNAATSNDFFSVDATTNSERIQCRNRNYRRAKSELLE